MNINDRRLRHVAARLRALGDETRLRLLLALRRAGGEASVGELAEAVEVPQPTASKHLARLKAVGLVASQRCGTTIRYRVEDPDLDGLCALLCAGVDRFLAQQRA
jgi:DNA-binding transcriptional ArsR family regulator